MKCTKLLIAIALVAMSGSYLYSIRTVKEDDHNCEKWHVWKSDIPFLSIAKCEKWKTNI